MNNTFRKLWYFTFSQVIFIVLFGNCLGIFGQWRFENWTTDNGLPQNGVRKIVQTPDGYLWFTTFDGLVRFDGVRFTTFGKGNTEGIYNSRFASLFCDKEGTLYASTSNEVGGLTIYKNGVFFSFLPNDIPGNHIKQIGADENGDVRFLIAENNGKINWYKLLNNSFVLSEESENPEMRYRGIAETIWTITDEEIIENRGSTRKTYKHPTANTAIPREGFADSKGGFWIGGKELVRLQNGKIQHFRDSAKFPANMEFHSFWEEEDGSIWFATGGKSGYGVGLVRYKDEVFTTLGEKEGLSDQSIFHAFKDREGIVWLATNRGLNKLQKSFITSYSQKDGLLRPEVNPLFRDSNNDIWIGTTGGINLFTNGKFIPLAYEADPSNMKTINTLTRYTQSFFEDSSEKIWIGTSEGILIREGKKIKRLKESANYSVVCIYQETADRIWAGTDKGILLIENYKIKNVYTTENGLPKNYTTSILKDSNGTLWFGTFGGLAKFENNHFTSYTDQDGLAGNTIRSLYTDKSGTLWIGTYDEGLSRYKNGKFTSIRSSDGLYNNGVFAIEEDDQGNFWISSNVGIYKVKLSELNDFADGKTKRIRSVGYGRNDGMLNGECNGGRQPASLKDENGHIWFPTQDGVVVINPELNNENKFPPKVVIESVTAEKEPFNVNEKIVIKPGKRNIEINYTGINLLKPDQIRFKYRLEGHDFDWVEAESRRSAFYSYLPPGTYQFRVFAANSDGIWSEEGAVITLEIKPFFYQTELFYLIISLSVLSILLIIWRLSIYRLKRRERELAALVNEKTNELQAANEELSKLADSDGLTKVGNRRFFEKSLHNEWLRCLRSGCEIALVLIDVDFFKKYNDTYGHQAGDICLKEVAAALKNSINRPGDSVSRFGGEEFAVVLGNTNNEGAGAVADRILTNIANLNIPHRSSPIIKKITVSIGTAVILPTKNNSRSELFEAADQALYAAKENGRNQIVSKNISR